MTAAMLHRDSASARGETDDGSDSAHKFELEAGMVLDARYRILRGIGGGGMGQVYEAMHVRLGQRVAIKFMRADHSGSESRRRRFEREARALAQIKSDHVVRVFDFGFGPSAEPFLVMDHLQGYDLRALLRQELSLPAPRAVRLALDVCAGLRAAHTAGIIHRDLKPENLFVVRDSDAAECCKVLDFGLAKLVEQGAPELYTKAGVPLGTLHYMSPEQARGESNIDARSDVYALCAILYEMLSARRPHQADTQHALLYQVVHEQPQRLEELCPFVPLALADAIHRGLSKQREQRTQSIELLTAELRPFAGKRTRAHENLISKGLSWDCPTETTTGAPPARRWSSPAAIISLGGIMIVATLLVLQARRQAPWQLPAGVVPRIDANARTLMVPVPSPSTAAARPVLPPAVASASGATKSPGPLPSSPRRHSDVATHASPRTRSSADPARVEPNADEPSDVSTSREFDRSNPYE